MADVIIKLYDYKTVAFATASTTTKQSFMHIHNNKILHLGYLLRNYRGQSKEYLIQLTGSRFLFFFTARCYAQRFNAAASDASRSVCP